MKKIPLFIFFLVTDFYLSAQSKSSSNNTSTFIHCSEFYVTPPMRDLPEYKPTPGTARREVDEKRMKNINSKSSILHSGNGYNGFNDPVRQTAQGTKLGSIAPIVNFEAMDDWEFDPPDPNGAVGDSLYVQMVNSSYTVYNKQGTQLLTPRDLEYFWHGVDMGDPVVLFDKFADRWFISEFQDSLIPYEVCVGVSKTSDPTGAYYVWKFQIGSGTTELDYPKYSIWTDGYYLTFQGFNGFSLNVPQQVAVLQRNRMLKGEAGAGMIIANLPYPPDQLGGNNSLESAPKTLDCDASALPPYGTPEYLVFFENIASGGYSDKIVMYKLVADTGANETLTVSRADSISVPAFNAYFNGNSIWNDISQPGYYGSSGNGLDALDGTFNFRVPFMVFPDHNSIVLSNTVNLGDTIAGIRWYELRQYTTNPTWIVYDSGTYGPDDTVSRWNAAICMDYDGDIALEYSVTSSSEKKYPVYPGIRYTGRLAGDPLGKMTFPEQIAIAGGCSLDPAKNNDGVGWRWGDYSELDIDPEDGITFWATNEYAANCKTIGNSYTQLQRIFSFQLYGNVGVEQVSNPTSLKVYQQSNYLEVIATGIPTDDQLSLDLFDIRGRQMTSQTVVPQSGQFQAQINVSDYAKGIYFVRISRTNFQRVVKVAIE